MKVRLPRKDSHFHALWIAVVLLLWVVICWIFANWMVW